MRRVYKCVCVIFFYLTFLLFLIFNVINNIMVSIFMYKVFVGGGVLEVYLKMWMNVLGLWFKLLNCFL